MKRKIPLNRWKNTARVFAEFSNTVRKIKINRFTTAARQVADLADAALTFFFMDMRDTVTLPKTHLVDVYHTLRHLGTSR